MEINFKMLLSAFILLLCGMNVQVVNAEEYYEVKFVVDKTSDGGDVETVSQLLRLVDANEKIGTLPQDPFYAGHTFMNWVDKNGVVVTEETVVSEDMEITAVFESIYIYTVTIQYYYEDCSSQKVVFDKTIILLDGRSITDASPLTVSSPSAHEVPNEVKTCKDARSNFFYPEKPTVTVQKNQLNKDNRSISIDVKYVPSTATYTYTYHLKNLSGTGYTKIEGEDESVDGVINSTVTATVKNFDYAVFESTTPKLINNASGIEIPVYYTRKDFLLLYDTQGGTPIPAVSSPYGSTVTVTTTTPTRQGYTFAGWFLDEACTVPAGTSVELTQNTTLHAKWTGKNVNYTIVYMKEVYDNTTNSTNYIYRSSVSATGQVGATVSANDVTKIAAENDGYELDAARNAVSQTVIKADGSAVVYVYYKLIRYTLVFNLNNDNGRINMSGKTYTGSNYKIQNVVLGQNISEYWPSSTTEVYSTATRGDRYFNGWTGAGSSRYVTKRNEVVWEMLSSANSDHVMTYKASWINSNNSTNVEYWLQQPDGSYAVADEYTLIGVNTGNETLGAKDIAGYTKRSGAPRGYKGSENNSCVTVHVKEYSFVDTYVDNGGHDTPEPSVKTMTKGGHVYTFVSSTMGNSSHTTSGHASSIPSTAERTIEVGGIIYSFVNSTVDSHEETIEAECTKKNGIGQCNQWKNYEPSITRDGHTYLYVRQYDESVLGWRTRYYVYSYTDYKYNYTNTSYTYTWVSKEGESTRDITNCGYTYRFYYDRLKYSIKYYDGSATLPTKSNIMFGANINNGTYNYVPAKPAGKEDYTWGGWYAQPELVDPYVFDVMPSSDLALYAKWIAPHYTVRFEYNYSGAAEPFSEEEIDKNKVTNDPGVPVRLHYTFDGWYTQKEGGRRYAVGSEAVTENITLYAHWSLNTIGYTVKYQDMDGKTLFTDKREESPLFEYHQEITEQALPLTGYIPEASSQTIQLDYENNVIVFRYAKKQEKNYYTVRYVLKDDPSILVHESKTNVEVDGHTISITEMAAAVDKAFMRSNGVSDEELLAATFYPEETSSSLPLSQNVANNVITFYYVSYATCKFTTKWLDMDGKPIPGVPTSVQSLKLGSTKVVNTSVPGYSYDHTWDSKSNANSSKIRFNINDASPITVYVYMKKVLTVRANDKNKTYDGTPLISEGVSDQTVSGLVSGDLVSDVTYTGSITDVKDNTQTSVPSGVIVKDQSDKDRNYYYDIRYENGALSIDPQKITISVNSNNVECDYDGLPHTATLSFPTIIGSAEFDAKYGTTLRTELAGMKLTKTDAGEYKISSEDILKNLPSDPNFEIQEVNKNDLTLIIHKVPLTVTTSSSIKAYDGTPLTNAEITVTGFVNGETATFATTGSQTEPGVSDNTYSLTFDKTAKEGNYYVNEETLGTLEVFSIECKDYGFLVYEGEPIEFPTPLPLNGTTVDEIIIEGTTLLTISDDKTKVSGVLPCGQTIVTFKAKKGTAEFTCESTIVVVRKVDPCNSK